MLFFVSFWPFFFLWKCRLLLGTVVLFLISMHFFSIHAISPKSGSFFFFFFCRLARSVFGFLVLPELLSRNYPPHALERERTRDSGWMLYGKSTPKIGEIVTPELVPSNGHGHGHRDRVRRPRSRQRLFAGASAFCARRRCRLRRGRRVFWG
jgi:hypothetical protein